MSALLNRVAAADPQSALAELAGSPLLEDGRAQIVGLEGVRGRFGASWPERRGRVYERIEAQAARILAADDLFLRIGEVDYLLVTAGPGAAAAQAAALHVLRELLMFLFGEFRPADLVVKSVTALDGDVATARRLSAEEVVGVLRYAPSLGPASNADAQPQSLRTLTGRRLQLDHVAAPLLDMRRGAVVGVSAWRRLTDEQTGVELGAAELNEQHVHLIEAVDLATVRNVAYWARASDRAERSIVVAPLSLHTLGSPRGRAALLEAAQTAQSELAARLVVEITGLAQGFLSSRVREAVAAIRPYCRAVFAQIPASRAAAEELSGCGLRGVSLLAADLARAAREESDQRHRRLVEAAALVGPGLMICGLRSVRAVALARTVGASLAVLDPDHAGAVLAG